MTYPYPAERLNYRAVAINEYARRGGGNGSRDEQYMECLRRAGEI